MLIDATPELMFKAPSKSCCRLYYTKWLKEVNMSMTLQSGHSIIASRRFSSMHVQPEENPRSGSMSEHTNSKRKKKMPFRDLDP